jgi:DNA recombination protein RmuC
MEIITLIIGIIVGIAAASLLLGKKADEAARLARSEGQVELARLTERLDAEKRLSAEKIAILAEAKEELSNQFKALASDILEDKSKRFTEQNQTNISQLLEPLKVKLTEFKGKVEEVYFQEGKERSALAEQVKSLMALNRQLSDDAHNLTLALKGSNKAQGNWGEMILEKILESSGLRKGLEYDVQGSHTLEDGSRLQPDVVIHLPGERHIVIDSKVSLLAYEEYMNADEAQREPALKRHLDSIRAHIKGLSEKNYQDIHGVKSLDFVIMFIPLEPAFMLASANDSALWQDAWKRNILLVSPGTLLFVLRTVAHLWRQEQQNKNAQEIAKRGAELYDKLAGFVDDLKTLGSRLGQAQKSYDDACGKFYSGKGNVIRQAEMLKDHGIKPGKSLPAELIDGGEDSALI